MQRLKYVFNAERHEPKKRQKYLRNKPHHMPEPSSPLPADAALVPCGLEWLGTSGNSA